MNQYTEDQPAEVNILEVVGRIDLGRPQTQLHLVEGRILLVPTSLLTQSSLQASSSSEASIPSISADFPGTESLVIPLVEEQLVVGKQTVETAKIRLHKSVQVYEEALDEPLAIRTFDIERVVLNRPVDAAPAVRQDGDTTIYPIVEEQLVLTKQLILKEEVHVTRRDTERRDTQTVTLRREHLVVEREQLP